MIITVTFNPAIDKTAEVDTLQIGGLNRLSNVMMDAGGKGINVSKTIQALGGTSLCTGFLAGSSGEYIHQTLQNLKIQSDFIWVNGMTRTNLKVLNRNMELTELNEAGPEIKQTEIEQLINKIVRLCNEDVYVVLSGNVSNGVSPNIYKDMIELIKRSGGKVVFDADGALFANGIKAKPYVIKPNKYELAMYFQVSESICIDEMIPYAKTLLNDDTKLVIISMGKEGSIFLHADGIWIANALDIKAHSSVGAGDAMVAAVTYALEQGYDLASLMRLAVAASAGAVMTTGTRPATKEVVDELMKYVNLKQWKELSR